MIPSGCRDRHSLIRRGFAESASRFYSCRVLHLQLAERTHRVRNVLALNSPRISHSPACLPECGGPEGRSVGAGAPTFKRRRHSRLVRSEFQCAVIPPEHTSSSVDRTLRLAALPYAAATQPPSLLSRTCSGSVQEPCSGCSTSSPRRRSPPASSPSARQAAGARARGGRSNAAGRWPPDPEP